MNENTTMRALQDKQLIWQLMHRGAQNNSGEKLIVSAAGCGNLISVQKRIELKGITHTKIIKLVVASNGIYTGHSAPSR